ncbi:MAG TPA: CHAT domain-containing protein [Pseudomonadota bacterium]|nr:CHAT domain-containing protein [Pseudomonadota bacterium]
MPKSKILLIAANPETLPPIDANRELRTIDKAVQKGQYRELLGVEGVLEVKVGELAEVLTKGRPRLLHVTCHGDEAGALQFRDTNVGTPAPVPPVELARLLRNAAPGAQCVVLSACYSEQQSERMLAEGILFVVGASQAINGEEANTFADVFYTALGNGLSLSAAFELARSTLGLEQLRQDALKLLAAPGQRPEDWRLVEIQTSGTMSTAAVSSTAIPPVVAPPPSPFGGGSTAVPPFVPANPSGALPQALRDQLLLARQLFEGSLTQMELIRLHKQIHDDLQGLEAALRLSLDKIDMAREKEGEAVLPPFPTIRPNLRDASTKIESLLQTMMQGPLQDKYEDVQTTLKAAGDRIKEALQARSLDPLTPDVNESLQSLLALELPKANDRLVAGVEQLQVDTLAQSLQSIRTAVSGLPLPPPALNALLVLASAFSGRAGELKPLNKEHGAWQTIDNKLRPLSGARDNLRKLLKSVWNTLPARIQTLLQSSTGEWVEQLKEQQEILRQEIANSDDNALRAEFDEFYRLVTQRFSAVDKMLLELSGKIGNDGREIYGQLKAMV